MTGIEVFRKQFAAYENQYVLIGGVACNLLMEEQGLDFRPTKDVDMVLIVEALTNEFVTSFWEFIEKGQYRARRRSTGTPEFYRFVEPQTPGYPAMIELFARSGKQINMAYEGHLTPLHFEEGISSLSAILLNEAYYSFLLGGRKAVGGIAVLDAVHLIPMKMKAWLDLNNQKAEGIHVNERDIRKHRQDVFRLFLLINPDEHIGVPDEVHRDIDEFIQRVRTDPFEPQSVGIPIGKKQILDIYQNLYYIS